MKAQGFRSSNPRARATLESMLLGTRLRQEGLFAPSVYQDGFSQHGIPFKDDRFSQTISGMSADYVAIPGLWCKAL
jgi:hypothetical protein